MNDKNLLIKAKGGDANAFTELFNIEFPKAISYLLKQFKWIDKEDCKDMAIEAVEEILLNLDDVDPDRAVGGLICTLAKWKALNFSKWSRRYSYIMDDRDVLLEIYTQIDGTEYDDKAAEQYEVMRDKVKKNIKRLSLIDYITLSMYMEGKTYGNIAQRLGVTLNAVNSRIRKAKKRLNILVNGREILRPYDTAKELYESIIDRDKLPHANLLKMYYSEGLSMQGIGKKTGIATKTVRSRIRTARDGFKFYLN